MIVTDPKGQLAAITARKRARIGRVIVSNPSGMFPELPHLQDAGWNPLLQVRQKGDEAGATRCTADAIITKSASGTGNGEFFEISAQNLLALFIM
jgi:type IV secretory pathway TraG/TraD family ATPase VirD4